MKKNILVISAPSGGGKSVVANYILSNFSNFNFSISSTTREKRESELDGLHYYFVNKNDFKNKISNDEFVEHEEIFGNYYGTLNSEINRIISLNKMPLFDIDVKGAYSIRKCYPDNSLLIFLKPPSIEILKERLINRKTEKIEQVNKRLERAELEINLSNDFDYILINDNLELLLSQVHNIIIEHF
jgi:guanylate kinase